MSKYGLTTLAQAFAEAGYVQEKKDPGNDVVKSHEAAHQDTGPKYDKTTQQIAKQPKSPQKRQPAKKKRLMVDR